MALGSVPPPAQNSPDSLPRPSGSAAPSPGYPTWTTREHGRDGRLRRFGRSPRGAARLSRGSRVRSRTRPVREAAPGPAAPALPAAGRRILPLRARTCRGRALNSGVGRIRWPPSARALESGEGAREVRCGALSPKRRRRRLRERPRSNPGPARAFLPGSARPHCPTLAGWRGPASCWRRPGTAGRGTPGKPCPAERSRVSPPDSSCHALRS